MKEKLKKYWECRAIMVCIALMWLCGILLPDHLVLQRFITTGLLIFAAVWGHRCQKNRQCEIEVLEKLQSYIRICAWCKKVEIDGEWVSFEEYLADTHGIDSSHGICPGCYEETSHKNHL